jgi:hypothetical protein
MRSRAARLLATGIGLCAAVLAYAAWSARPRMPRAASESLDRADRYELLSLYPYLSENEFYNHRVLGRTTVSDPATRKKLNAGLRAGARESDGSRMACFSPRHGIRVTERGRVTDFVICFECRQVRVYRDGVNVASFLTSASPQGVFDDVLRREGVPLAGSEE